MVFNPFVLHLGCLYHFVFPFSHSTLVIILAQFPLLLYILVKN